MPEAIITTPKGPTYQTVSDYTTYLDADSRLIQYGQRCEPFRANEAITKYQAVAFVAATATVPLSVEVLDVSDALLANNVFVGVAQEAGAAGDIISVCVQGVTLAKVDTDDPVLGSLVVLGGSDGTLGAVLIGAQDATIIEATAFGVFLDVENASDVAPIRLWGR